jgi:6-phosphogluconate dehydrogenase
MNMGQCELGMVGLGVMGRNLLLNVADHRFAAAGYDLDAAKVESLRSEANGRNVYGVGSLGELVTLLRRPRAVMLLVPAGQAVDAVIGDLTPLLEPGDVIIDGGNSHFKDTDRRMKALTEQGLHFLGVGISGGEHGARHGPSIMPGGPEEAYQRVRPVLEAIAARVQGEPCVAYMGPGSAGHYVKMVHNGIEYGLMRLIAETYHLMKQGLGLSNQELAEIYQEWNDRELSAYLVEITSHIFRQVDGTSQNDLIDMILDESSQKGTGMWTSEDALVLQVPVVAIDVAVAMREMSVLKIEREAASRVLPIPAQRFQGSRKAMLIRLRHALHAAMIITYAQGMAQLRRASETYGYRLNLEDVARVWRGGCIIRAAVLEDILAAYRLRPDLPNLLLDPRLAELIMAQHEELRIIVRVAAELAIPAPGFMVSLAYFDSYRSAWLPDNLIAAQRDYFGAHGYERIDAVGTFHTSWEEPRPATASFAPIGAIPMEYQHGPHQTSL